MQKNSIARDIISKESFVVFNKVLFIYDKTSGVYSSDVHLMNNIFLSLYDDLKPYELKNIREYILNKLYISKKRSAPDDFINFKNCLFDLKNEKIIKHTPEVFTINQINAILPILLTTDGYELNINLKNNIVDEYLDALTNCNKERRKALLEYNGYSMTIRTDMQKMLILYGASGSNGKTTYLNIIQKLFGNENVTNNQISSLVGKPFTVSSLKNKLVNIDTEGTKFLLKDLSILRQLITGDNIASEAKFEAVESGSMYCKLIQATNRLMRTSDTTDSFFRRLLFVVCDNNFSPSANFDIQKLETTSALSYLALISLKAYLEIKNKTFSNQEESNAIVEQYKMNSDSFYAFLNDNSSTLSDSFLSIKDIREAYNRYCYNNNFPFNNSLTSIKDYLNQYKNSFEIKNDSHNHRTVYRLKLNNEINKYMNTEDLQDNDKTLPF